MIINHDGICLRNVGFFNGVWKNPAPPRPPTIVTWRKRFRNTSPIPPNIVTLRETRFAHVRASRWCRVFSISASDERTTFRVNVTMKGAQGDEEIHLGSYECQSKLAQDFFPHTEVKTPGLIHNMLFFVFLDRPACQMRPGLPEPLLQRLR